MTEQNNNKSIPVFLAPMAGFTDRSFRSLCREFGCSGTCTEMVSAKGLLFDNDNTIFLLDTAENDYPVSVQLFGRVPEELAKAARIVELKMKGRLASIDINMGCPAPKITKNGEGSALMLEPKLAGDIMKAVSDSVSVKVGVKIRKGFDADHENVLDFAKRMEDSGAEYITVHGRNREQMYSGKADWECIRKVKQSLQIPVIGNGDIVDAESAEKILDETGCDGIMIGRAALGNPWIFEEIQSHYLIKDYTKPSMNDRLKMALRHAEMTVEHKGPHGVIELRKHMGFYLKGLRGATEIRKRLQYANTLEELREILLDTQVLD